MVDFFFCYLHLNLYLLYYLKDFYTFFFFTYFNFNSKTNNVTYTYICNLFKLIKIKKKNNSLFVLLEIIMFILLSISIWVPT